MLQEERYQRITTLITSFKRVSTDQIIRELQVSRETVRRDLLALEGLGQLRRVHGGVVVTNYTPEEPPLSERLQARHIEKRAIARQAALSVPSGSTVFLDTGSTTLAVADELLSLSGLTIITNSIDIATRFVGLDASLQSRNRLIILPGTVSAGLPAIYGENTIADVARYYADVAILSPTALDTTRGAMSFNHQEAAIARAMCDNARNILIVADHSKIGQSSRISFCGNNAIDQLITDSKANDVAALPAFERLGIKVQIALANDN